MTPSRRSIFRPWHRRLLAMLLCVMVMSPSLAAAGQEAPPQPAAQQPTRLDAYLRAAADSPRLTTQRVIIRVRAGARDAVRLAVTDAGDEAISGLGANSLVALVRSDRLGTLAAREDVLSISSDGRVGAHGQRPGGLLGGVAASASASP